MGLKQLAASWLTRRGRQRRAADAGPRLPVCLLNAVFDAPTTYPAARCTGDLTADVHLLDYNYLDRERMRACVEAVLARADDPAVAVDRRTLLLNVTGLHPFGPDLLQLARRYRAHHVFYELWNGLNEVVALCSARPEHLYFLPVNTRLERCTTARVAATPNRHVFVSLGGDDALDLIRAVVAACPDLHFHVPDTSWHKPGSQKEFFAVHIDAPNVTAVDCAIIRHEALTFPPAYRPAYDACDTVLIATQPDRMFQMRGGVRLADALHARKHVVVTENAPLQVLMAQHERTCLVTGHDVDAIAAALRRVAGGGFQVDAPCYEAVRQLTTAGSKLAWMVAAAADPAAAGATLFAARASSLAAVRAALFPRGQALLDREIESHRRRTATAGGER